MSTSTPSAAPMHPSESLADLFSQLYSFFYTIVTRFFTNLYSSFAEVSGKRWTKVIGSVIFYVLIRPYIEKFFAKTHERSRKKREEKEKKEKEEAEGGNGSGSRKKAKVSANAFRGSKGEGESEGKVLGEVENTDDEVDDEADEKDEKKDDGVDFATASGVPEWGKGAKKRGGKKAAKEESHGLSDEQLMEMLDWSESEKE